MELDFASLKPSVYNWLAVGLMAVTFIVIAKWLMTRWPVAGLADVINMV